MPRLHTERHYFDRIGWLRAAVLGANDGIVSTASLVVGVAASGAEKSAILIAGVAGLVAGAMSMAAGEYVSVSSQSDTEAADLNRERQELATEPEHELVELTNLYVQRGLSLELATDVARALTAHDALGAHAREELGIVEHQRANPLQAAFASAGTFAVGAALPLVVAWLSPTRLLAWIVTGSALAFLMLLGWTSANAGGANRVTGTARVTFWGAIAMAITYGVGRLFGAVV
jgi:VIT1/CCC1 family predicted Fe2+/Mn2+ transporter